MTTALPPSVLPTAAAAVPAVSAVTPVTGIATVAQVAPILAAAQAALANTVNLSPQAQQVIKAEAFAQLVSQLVQHIQGSHVQLPANWPAGGVTPQWQALLTGLVQQASTGQPLPQQLVAAQSWPSALTQAVLQGAGAPTLVPASPGAAAGQPTALPPHASAAGSPNAASSAVPTAMPAASGAPVAVPLPSGLPMASLAAAAAVPAGMAALVVATASASSVDGTDMVRPALPALQNWVVQQGVLQGPDGERAFTLTLKVPVAWAQAQSALGQALTPPMGGGAAAVAVPGAMLQLPFGNSVQQLSNATFGLVMAPQGLPAAQTDAMRTSAVLQMDFQPLPAAVGSAVQQATAVALLPPGVLPQEAYQALLARSGDPWLHMAQQQASGVFPRERPPQHEGHCEARDCQYQGRAECAQPFCAEMNSLWATDRASRAGRS